jgi:hypothetical protein
MILNIIIMSLHGLHFIKTIDITKAIKDYIKKLSEKKPTEEITKLQNSI